MNFNFRTLTAPAYFALPQDNILSCDASANAMTIKLETFYPQGQMFQVVKSDASANAVTVKDASGTIIAILPRQNCAAILYQGETQDKWRALLIGLPNCALDLHSSGQPALNAADGVDTTPSATETYVTRILVPNRMTLTGVKLFNGSDVTGNVRIGLATADGTPIAGALTASTAGSGTDAYQTIPFAAPYVAEAGYYHVCIQYSSATARFNAHAWGNDWSIVKTGTVFGTMPTLSALPTQFVAAAANIFSLY